MLKELILSKNEDMIPLYDLQKIWNRQMALRFEETPIKEIRKKIRPILKIQARLDKKIRQSWDKFWHFLSTPRIILLLRAIPQWTELLKPLYENPEKSENTCPTQKTPK